MHKQSGNQILASTPAAQLDVRILLPSDNIDYNATITHSQQYSLRPLCLINVQKQGISVNDQIIVKTGNFNKALYHYAMKTQI